MPLNEVLWPRDQACRDEQDIVALRAHGLDEEIDKKIDVNKINCIS